MRLYRLSKPGSIDNLKLTQEDAPKPGRGQVLVRMHAASLNYRDYQIVAGIGRSSARPELIPLSDGAGEVMEIGADVTRVKVGDRVAGVFHQTWLGGESTDNDQMNALGGPIHGVLAEYVVLDQNGLVHIPDHLSFEEAATLPCAALTAWSALTVAQVPLAGQNVLVLGTGGVSIFALQLAHMAGARVIITSSSDAKLERARKLGASETINYKTTPEWQDVARKLTGGRGIDIVVEIGGEDTLRRSLLAVRRGGTISTIGARSGSNEISILPIMLRTANLRPISVGSRQSFEAMNRAIFFHKLRPVIDKTFPFEDAAGAYRHMESQAHFGKIVIRIA